MAGTSGFRLVEDTSNEENADCRSVATVRKEGGTGDSSGSPARNDEDGVEDIAFGADKEQQQEHARQSHSTEYPASPNESNLSGDKAAFVAETSESAEDGNGGSCGSAPHNEVDVPDNASSVQRSRANSYESVESLFNETTPHKKDRMQWDAPPLPFLPTTKFEVYLMLQHIAIRHGATGPFVEDFLKFVNCLLPLPVLPASEYFFKKLFQPASDATVHFYCSSCDFYLGKKDQFDSETTLCNVCGETCNVRNLSDNFFLSLSVKKQVEAILQRPGLKWVSRKDRPEGVYSDVVDGDMYKMLTQPGQPLEDENSLSLTFNTDGAKIQKGQKVTLGYPSCD